MKRKKYNNIRVGKNSAKKLQGEKKYIIKLSKPSLSTKIMSYEMYMLIIIA